MSAEGCFALSKTEACACAASPANRKSFAGVSRQPLKLRVAIASI
jgi:hypothetical protein